MERLNEKVEPLLTQVRVGSARITNARQMRGVGTRVGVCMIQSTGAGEKRRCFLGGWTEFRYRAVEPSSGSNVIPGRARPGLAGLRPHGGH